MKTSHVRAPWNDGVWSWKPALLANREDLHSDFLHSSWEAVIWEPLDRPGFCGEEEGGSFAGFKLCPEAHTLSQAALSGTRAGKEERCSPVPRVSTRLSVLHCGSMSLSLALEATVVM